jgi:hypothetical protein
LTVAGRHLGRELTDDNPLADDWFEVDLGLKPPPCSAATDTAPLPFPMLG